MSSFWVLTHCCVLGELWALYCVEAGSCHSGTRIVLLHQRLCRVIPKKKCRQEKVWGSIHTKLGPTYLGEELHAT